MRNYPEQAAEDKCPPFENISTSRQALRRHRYVLQRPLKALSDPPEPCKRCPRAQAVTAVSGAAVKPRDAWDGHRPGTVLPLPAQAQGLSPDPAEAAEPPHPPEPPEPPGTHRARARGSPHSPQGVQGRREGGREERREGSGAGGGRGRPWAARAAPRTDRPVPPPSCDAAHVSATAAGEGQPAPSARGPAGGCRAVLVELRLEH